MLQQLSLLRSCTAWTTRHPHSLRFLVSCLQETDRVNQAATEQYAAACAAYDAQVSKRWKARHLHDAVVRQTTA